MRKWTARSGLLLIFAAILTCLAFGQGFAQDAVDSSAATSASSGTSTTTTASTTTETSTTSTADDAVGAGIFARPPVKISLSLQTGYDDNVTTFNADKQGSGYTAGSVALAYNFGTPRTQLSLQSGVGVTYFWQHIRTVGIETNDYDIAIHLTFTLTHKASPRLTLHLASYTSYRTEPDFTEEAGLNRRTGNFLTTNNTFGATYLWTPRFSTNTSYTFLALNYDDETVGQFQDRIDNTLGNEFRFAVLPGTSLVAEYRFRIVSYIHDTSRHSTSHVFLGGLDHTFDPRLKGTLRVGAQFRDNQGDSRNSPYFEGTLHYTLGKQTNILWTNRYSIEEPDDPVSQGRETFRTGLTASHNFTPRIRGSLNGYYQHGEYQFGGGETGRTEDWLDLGLSLRYSITRYWGVEAGYNFTDVSSDNSLREYSRNRYWAGVNFTF